MRSLIALALVSLILINQAAGQQATKKGFGLPESRLGLQQLSLLNVKWYYNWGASTALTTSIPFVPMIYSSRRISSAISGNYVLGFNEPDNANQSDMLVSDALQYWPMIVSKAANVGSPAMAGNPVTGSWLPQFMAALPKVDFVCVHWYKGPDVAKFKSDMQAIYNAYRLPIWVTEYAPQTASSASANPSKYSQDSIDNFITKTSQWMEQATFIERYAWHDSEVGTSSFFDSDGALTPSGITYASL